MKTPDLSPYELAFQAESGDPAAQFRLGMLFLLGERVEQDLPAAYRWIARAADAQHASAQVLAAKLAAIESVRQDKSPGVIRSRAGRLHSWIRRAFTDSVETIVRLAPLHWTIRRFAQPASGEVRPIGAPRKSTSLVDAA